MSHGFTELIDAAQDEQRRINEAAEAATRAKAAPEHDPAFDGKHCIECGALIPIKRRELGKIKCVICQELLERSNKMKGIK